jgi:hypothetical protein
MPLNKEQLVKASIARDHGIHAPYNPTELEFVTFGRKVFPYVIMDPTLPQPNLLVYCMRCCAVTSGATYERHHANSKCNAVSHLEWQKKVDAAQLQVRAHNKKRKKNKEAKDAAQEGEDAISVDGRKPAARVAAPPVPTAAGEEEEDDESGAGAGEATGTPKDVHSSSSSEEDERDIESSSSSEEEVEFDEEPSAEDVAREKKLKRELNKLN